MNRVKIRKCHFCSNQLLARDWLIDIIITLHWLSTVDWSKVVTGSDWLDDDDDDECTLSSSPR